MNTRLTDEVLANVHGDLQKCHELHPVNNQLMAEILNRMDEITVGGFDADAAAAAMFAFSSVLGSHQVTAPAGATLQDIVTFLATMATLTGQALHAQTHAIADESVPVRHGDPVWLAEEPEEWRSLPHNAPQVIKFDSIPWPPDRRETIPTAVVGALPTPYQLEALRQYRAARGLPTLISVVRLTAAEVNQAVDWWNHRAAMLNAESPK